MRAASVVLGAVLYGLALPPWGQAWWGWLVLVPVLLAVRGASPAAALRYGLLFGYASGWAVLWSLPETAGAYLGVPLPLAVAGAALWFLVVVGVPFALFAAGAAVLSGDRLGRASPLAVGALWVAAELVRGRGLGQPWGLLGYTQYEHHALVQVAALTGVYGVSFVLAATSAGIAEGLVWLRARRPERAAVAVALPSALALAVWAGGASALARDAEPPRAAPVTIVQTNLTPPLQWTPTYSAAQVGAHVRATARLSRSLHPALIVWPEYAVPRYVESDPGLRAVLGATARRHGADLLFGTPRAEGGRRFNSATLVRRDGRIAAHYDKRRLVPFAEATPLWGDGEAFAAGDSGGVLPGFVPLGVSICHEVLHPDLIAASVREGARLLVNVANDSWLERLSDGAGRQHLGMASMRAVETRRFVVRAAITGASAVFDPFGRMVASLPPGRPGVLTAWVAPRETTTWYVRLGDAFAFGCVAAALLATLLAASGSAARPRPVAGRGGTE